MYLFSLIVRVRNLKEENDWRYGNNILLFEQNRNPNISMDVLFYFIAIYFTTFWGCCASFVGWSFVGINPSFKYMHVLVLRDLIDTFSFMFCKIINFHDFISLCVGWVHTQRDMHSIILYFYSGSMILV